MNAVKATWKNGQVVLDGRADWPEGRRLVVAEAPFVEDDDQPDDPDAIAQWITEFDAIPPLEMTPIAGASPVATNTLLRTTPP